MSQLAKIKCEVCRTGAASASPEECDRYMQELPDWKIVKQENEDRLEREFEFDDFKKALQFTLEVGRLAEEVDHHPKIVTEYGKVTVTWWTHKIGGLHLTDFVMAARTDELFK